MDSARNRRGSALLLWKTICTGMADRSGGDDQCKIAAVPRARVVDGRVYFGIARAHFHIFVLRPYAISSQPGAWQQNHHPDGGAGLGAADRRSRAALADFKHSHL